MSDYSRFPLAVGDKVKIIGKLAWNGAIGTICKLNGSNTIYPYSVRFDDAEICIFARKELELVCDISGELQDKVKDRQNKPISHGDIGLVKWLMERRDIWIELEKEQSEK